MAKKKEKIEIRQINVKLPLGTYNALCLVKQATGRNFTQLISEWILGEYYHLKAKGEFKELIT